MTVKKLVEELKKYPEDTKVFIENRDDNFWITYIQEPWLEYKDEIKYISDDWDMYYANYLKYDWILNDVLVIN